MNKIILFLGLALGLHNSGVAQEMYNSTGRKGEANYRSNQSVSGFDMNKLILGGGVSLNMWNNLFAAGIYPVIGYKFNNTFSAGFSLGYLYQSYKDHYKFYDNNTGEFFFKPLRSNLFRTGVWGRVMLFENIYAHAEFEYNMISNTTYQAGFYGIEKVKYKDNVPSLLVGAGYKSPISENVSFVTTLLYDVLQNIPSNTVVEPNGNKYSRSPYAGNLEFRVGILVGF